MSQATAPIKQDEKKTAAEEAASMKPVAKPEHRWLREARRRLDVRDARPQRRRDERPRDGTRERARDWRDRVQLEGDGEMPDGSPATTVMTLGDDPDRKRVIGSWIGPMMTHQWVYDGELDLAKNTLVLNADGPSMKGDGTTARYRDTVVFRNDNERTLTASVQEPDGSWKTFMSMTYRRKP